MLGWERIEAIDGETKDFYIRQLWDAKGSVEIERMNPAGLNAYGAICGWTLAWSDADSRCRVRRRWLVGRRPTVSREFVQWAARAKTTHQSVRDDGRRRMPAEKSVRPRRHAEIWRGFPRPDVRSAWRRLPSAREVFAWRLAVCLPAWVTVPFGETREHR